MQIEAVFEWYCSFVAQTSRILAHFSVFKKSHPLFCFLEKYKYNYYNKLANGVEIGIFIPFQSILVLGKG